MKQTKKNPDWAGKIGNVSQLGGIETSVLDNGPAHGSRVDWLDPGSRA